VQVKIYLLTTIISEFFMQFFCVIAWNTFVILFDTNLHYKFDCLFFWCRNYSNKIKRLLFFAFHLFVCVVWLQNSTFDCRIVYAFDYKNYHNNTIRKFHECTLHSRSVIWWRRWNPCKLMMMARWKCTILWHGV
jgi:hypothetical protein